MGHVRCSGNGAVVSFGQASSHNVVTKTKCGLWALGGDRVRELIKDGRCRQVLEILELLRSVPKLSQMGEARLGLVARSAFIGECDAGKGMLLAGCATAAGKLSYRMLLLSGEAAVVGGG